MKPWGIRTQSGPNPSAQPQNCPVSQCPAPKQPRSQCLPPCSRHPAAAEPGRCLSGRILPSRNARGTRIPARAGRLTAVTQPGVRARHLPEQMNIHASAALRGCARVPGHEICIQHQARRQRRLCALRLLLHQSPAALVPRAAPKGVELGLFPLWVPSVGHPGQVGTSRRTPGAPRRAVPHAGTLAGCRTLPAPR